MIIRRKHIVYATRQFLIERRRNRGMCGYREIKNDNAIDSVRRAFTRQRGVPAIGRHRDVVDGARIHLDRIGLDDVAQICDVENQRIPIAAPRPNDTIIAAVLARPWPQIGRVRVADRSASRDRYATHNITRLYLKHFARRHIA